MSAPVVAHVPFVDVLATMLDETLPLTPGEWPEWGNPIEDPEAYDYMMSYSPYDQVEAKAYPAVLATGGLSDPRVTYWEPEKWVAKLRPATTSGKPVLLKRGMAATVDEVSGGRLILGLGAGWNRVEFDAFGFPYDKRVARFEEAFTIIRRLLDGETVTDQETLLQGYGRIRDVRMAPDGFIYIANESNGTIVRLVPAE